MGGDIWNVGKELTAIVRIAVYFFLADGDLQQREWIFCSSVISQKV